MHLITFYFVKATFLFSYFFFQMLSAFTDLIATVNGHKFDF